MKKYKYALFVNGVLWDYFYTIKEIDEFLFEHNLDNNSNYYVQVKKI